MCSNVFFQKVHLAGVIDQNMNNAMTVRAQCHFGFQLMYCRELGYAHGNTEDDITKILSSVGVEADKEQLALLLKELEGKDLDELIKAGSTKLMAVGGGGGAAPGAGAAAGGAAAEEKKEEEPEEEEEQEQVFDLFDDDDDDDDDSDSD